GGEGVGGGGGGFMGRHGVVSPRAGPAASGPRPPAAYFCRLAAGILGLIEGKAERNPPNGLPGRDHAMTHPRVALLAAALLLGPGTVAYAQMIVGPAAGPGPGPRQAPPPGSSGMIVSPATGPSAGPMTRPMRPPMA